MVVPNNTYRGCFLVVIRNRMESVRSTKAGLHNKQSGLEMKKN
jgi:hypothetical protein